MGEARYYMKVYFQTEQDVLQNLPKIMAFWEEGIKAEDWWQTHRGESSAIFWAAFEQEFPLVSEMLRQANLFGGDCNNDLAGHLDFGDSGDYCIEEAGNSILINATVWHFANWDIQKAFILHEFQALAVNWLSDEYLNPFDLL